MFDPGTIKIIISYLMVTGSVNSSMNVETPQWLQNITNFLKFDPSGVLMCLIQAFEYTFYHNVILMATIPYTAYFMFVGAARIGTSIVKISYNNKKKIAQDEEELEFLEEEENQTVYDLNESCNGLMSEFLIFVHPNITEVMFGMLECEPVLGYDLTWLVNDYRMQCMDNAYILFGLVAIYTVLSYSIGLPLYYLLTLLRRRHRLDEAKAVVIKRYSAWRAHLKRAADLRIPEEDMAGAEELVKVDADIMFMHSQYEKYKKEWDQFAFIYEDYQVQYYYWELVEIVRKQLIVAFSSILAIVGEGYDIIFGCFVSFVFFALHCGVLPYVEDRENFIKGGEIGTTYLSLFLILLRMLAESNSEYNRDVLNYLTQGTTIVFFSVVGYSLIWNFQAGMEELEAIRAEEAAEEEGGGDKLSLESVFFAVKLVNRCVRNRINKRYQWDQASSIGGDSLLSSHAASSRSITPHGSHRTGSQIGIGDDDDNEVGFGFLMQPHVRQRWQRIHDRLMLIEGLPEPDYSSQDTELGLLSEDTASVLDDLFADPTDDDVSDIRSESEHRCANVHKRQRVHVNTVSF